MSCRPHEAPWISLAPCLLLSGPGWRKHPAEAGGVGLVRPGVMAGWRLVHCRDKTEPPRILLEGDRLQRSTWHLAHVGLDKPELP